MGTGTFDGMMNSISRFQADSAQSSEALARTRSAGDDAALREAAQQFEALFVKQMLNSMRATLDTKSDMLYGGLSQDIFEDMLYDEYSRIFAKTGDLGIADLIYRQLQ